MLVHRNRRAGPRGGGREGAHRLNCRPARIASPKTRRSAAVAGRASGRAVLPAVETRRPLRHTLRVDVEARWAR